MVRTFARRLGSLPRCSVPGALLTRMPARLARCPRPKGSPRLLACVWQLAAVVLGAAVAAHGQAAGLAILRGRVSVATGRPIVGAEVGVLGDSMVSAVADSLGQFVLSSIGPGTHVVRVRRIGFRAAYFSAHLEPGEVKQVAIVMEPGEYELPEIRVTARSAKPIEYAWTTKYDDFFRRQRVGFGYFLTRDDIDKKHPYRTPNLLAGIPGVKLRFRHSGSSGTEVYFTGCTRVSVWVDGWRQRYPEIPEEARNAARTKRMTASGFLRSTGPDTLGMALGNLLERVLPSQIELMEVYKGASQIPAEFLDDSCAAVVMWTR